MPEDRKNGKTQLGSEALKTGKQTKQQGCEALRKNLLMRHYFVVAACAEGRIILVQPGHMAGTADKVRARPSYPIGRVAHFALHLCEINAVTILIPK